MCSCFHEETNIDFITYIYIIHYQLSINFQLLSNLAGFPDIFNLIRRNRFQNSQNAKFLRLTSWQYVFNEMQTSVNLTMLLDGVDVGPPNNMLIRS